MLIDNKQDQTAKKKQDDLEHEKQDALIDVGLEESFPASDPPSYMGGIAVAGPPPHDGPPREPVFHELIDPEEARPEDNPPRHKGSGRKSD